MENMSILRIYFVANDSLNESKRQSPTSIIQVHDLQDYNVETKLQFRIETAHRSNDEFFFLNNTTGWKSYLLSCFSLRSSLALRALNLQKNPYGHCCTNTKSKYN